MSYQVTDVRANSGDSGFLLRGEDWAVVYDTGFGFSGKDLASNIEKALGGQRLDAVLLTHSHYDHALGAAHVKDRWPEAKIVAGQGTKDALERGDVRQRLREMDAAIAAKFGITDYDTGLDRLCVDTVLQDGESITFGSRTFTLLHLPGHTRCSVGYYAAEEKLLLGCESLGVFGKGGEVFPACLVGYEMSLASIARVREMDVKHVVVPHCGLLSEEETARYLDRCRESTVETAELICGILRRGGSKEEAIDAFKALFYGEDVRAFYPEEAMRLNTGLMVDLFAKELLEKPVL